MPGNKSAQIIKIRTDKNLRNLRELKQKREPLL